MTAPVICAPQWWARAALHGAVSASRIRARSGEAPGAYVTRPQLVAGTTTALTEDVRPGDLVVADELRTADGEAAIPAGPLLFGAVSRLSLRAHLGPLLWLPGLRAEWA